MIQRINFGTPRSLASAVGVWAVLTIWLLVAVFVVMPSPSVQAAVKTTNLQISTQPTLIPDFSASITDYVTRCDPATPFQVSVSAPDGINVSVAGGPTQGGAFTVAVDLAVGERFDVIVKAGRSRPVAYHVRCLPSDFPSWTTQRPGAPQADFYAVAPFTPSSTAKQYMAIFDNHGVPLWWISPKTPTFDAMLLPNGNFAWVNSHASLAATPTTGFEEHALDGALVRHLDTVGGPADNHELVRLPNGNYVMAANVFRSGVDFSSWGVPPGNLLDDVIQEFTPQGKVVWSWRTSDHIPVSETDPQWRSPPATLYDAYHINSIEPTRSGFIVSFRHLNAIYSIDRASGSILWKLGGSTRAESLTVRHDPIFDSGGSLAGQHDARLLPDGSVTLHDNGTNRGRVPRAVRYKINNSSRTATLLENVTDAAVTSSGCCGSARRLPSGNWVASWGQSPTFAELTPAGDPVFRVTFTTGTFSYRAQPLFTSDVKASALRSAMDARMDPTRASYIADPPTTWSPGQTQAYEVTVTNSGSEVWNQFGPNAVQLGVHFADRPGGYGHNTWFTDQRWSLPNDLGPGESVTIPVQATASTQGGHLTLETQMVKGDRSWFRQFTDTRVTVR
jgi:hypothetical protein